MTQRREEQLQQGARARSRSCRSRHSCSAWDRRRVGKLALIKHQRYAHAHQFKRANRSLLQAQDLSRADVRNIERHIAGNEVLREVFARPLYLARRVLEQERRQRERKVYSLHAPEVGCIGKGKAHRPYEFGVKVSVATTAGIPPAGSSSRISQRLPGTPYDGHTLATVIPQMQALVGNVLDRCITDAGYRGHNVRSYLFWGLYYGKFAPLDNNSLEPALENLNKAIQLNPKSALPQLFKAKRLGNLFVFQKRLNNLGWSDAERDKLDAELVAEYSKALALDPNLLPALKGRALAFFHLK